MSAAGRWLVVAVAFALALMLAWRAWPPGRAGESDPTSARPAPSRPVAARPTASVDERARSSSPAPAAARTGIPACDDYVARTMTCDQLPDDARIAIAEASKAWAQLAAAGPRPDLEASCRASAAVQQEALAAMGC